MNIDKTFPDLQILVADLVSCAKHHTTWDVKMLVIKQFVAVQTIARKKIEMSVLRTTKHTPVCAT